MRLGETDPDPTSPPQQPVLIATGTEDPIHDQSARLASLLPRGEFSDIPGRHHVNAPGARTFREAGLEFLAREV
jgi:pimeloyl-ACP methyl ester carboxylesterase